MSISFPLHQKHHEAPRFADYRIYFLGDLEIPRVFPCSKIAATLTHHTAQPCGIEPKDPVGPLTFFHHSWPLYLSSSLLKFDGFIFLIFFVLRSYLVLSFFPCLLSWLQSPIDSLICLFMFSIHRITLICLCLVHGVFVCWCSDLVVNSVTCRTCCLYLPLTKLRRDIAIFNARQECLLGVAQASYHGAKTTALGQPALPRWPGAPRTTGQESGLSWEPMESVICLISVVSVGFSPDNHIVGSRFQMCWALWHCIFWAWVSNRPTLWIVKL